MNTELREWKINAKRKKNLQRRTLRARWKNGGDFGPHAEAGAETLGRGEESGGRGVGRKAGGNGVNDVCSRSTDNLTHSDSQAPQVYLTHPAAGTLNRREIPPKTTRPAERRLCPNPYYDPRSKRFATPSKFSPSNLRIPCRYTPRMPKKGQNRRNP